MTGRLQKELTFTLGQILAICSVCLIPGLASVTVFVQRMTALETWKTEHVAADLQRYNDVQAAQKELKGQLDAANENLTKARISIGRLLPSAAAD